VASHPNADPGPSGDLVGTAPAARLLVVSRFSVAGAGARAEFVSSAESALAALAGQRGCLAASLGQATDDPDLLVLRTEWEGVGAYRRALSAFDVKVHAVPLLSTAIDEPSAYEVVRFWDGDGLAAAASGLAADAGEVGLGQAAAPSVRSVQS